MSDTTARRAKELFLAALDEPAGSRGAFVERACAGEPELRARVEKLLGAHERAAALDGALTERALRASSREVADASPRFGDYEILEEIASGAMGTVYRARQAGLGRLVALKMLRVGRFATDGEVRRFRAEAEAVARLDHPNIVPVYEVGEHEGRHFFSMKLVEGPSLSQAGERFRRDPRSAARLLARVARAVHHAHLHGVLHRDLKPSNILLDAEGVPFVVDFGVAKRVGEGIEETATGWILGTPAYMAPEQATEGGDVTVASDVYSLGCVLFWMLAGRAPFEGASVIDILRKLREELPPRFASLGLSVERDLETICRRALAKDAQQRYGSALALARDLERWLDHLPIEARPSSPLERLRLLFRRKPLTASLAAAVALLVLLIAGGATAASLALRERLHRAEKAERAATERLRGSLLAQARANRRSLTPGRRGESLALLAQAAAIEPGADLRDEAITCLSLTDLSVRSEWRRPGAADFFAGADARLERFILSDPGGEVSIVRASDGAELARFEGGTGQAWIGRFDPSGRLVALKHHDAQVPSNCHYSVWDVERGQRLLDVRELVNSGALQFDPRERYLAAGVRDGVALHELERLDRPPRRIATGVPVDAVRFAPDGSVLAIALRGDPQVRVYRVEDGAFVAALPALPAATTALCWSERGDLLAAACFDFRTYVFRWPSLETAVVLSGHQAEVTEVMLSAGGLAATYGWDETTRLFDLVTGEELCVADARARGFSRDGGALAFTTNDTAGVWTVERGGAFRVLYGHEGKSPTCVAADPRGRWLASGGTDGVLVRELVGGTEVKALAIGVVEGVFFTADGSALFTSGERGLLRFALPEALAAGEEARFEPWIEGACGRMSSSADGRTIAVVRTGGVQVVLDGDPTRVRMLEGPRGLDSPTVDPSGALVATGSWRGSGVRVWDARTGEVLREFLPETTTARPVFSPDGARLVAGTPEEYRVWRVADWSVERVIPRPIRLGNLPGAIAFDAWSGEIAIAIRQRVVELRDVASGELRATLAATDSQALSDMCFLPDGGGLVLASPTRRVQIWRLDRVEEELARWGVR